MKKTCCNCHWGQGVGNNKICFPGCFSSHDHYNWSPLTNGDMVRKMTDRELADLWGKTVFDDYLYIPDGCNPAQCGWSNNFSCECCPETFYNWLQSEVTADESTDN